MDKKNFKLIDLFLIAIFICVKVEEVSGIMRGNVEKILALRFITGSIL